MAHPDSSLIWARVVCVDDDAADPRRAAGLISLAELARQICAPQRPRPSARTRRAAASVAFPTSPSPSSPDDHGP